MLPFKYKEKGKRAPKKVSSPRVLLHTCAGGGWRTQHAHRNCSFFVPVSFFFQRKFVKSRWFFCALCAMQLRAWCVRSLIYSQGYFCRLRIWFLFRFTLLVAFDYFCSIYSKCHPGFGIIIAMCNYLQGDFFSKK